MLTPAETTTLLDLTMDVLDGELAGTTPQSGLGVIDRWLHQLQQTYNAQEITKALEELKTHLKSDKIDTEKLSKLLNKLSTLTIEFSTNMGSEGDTAPRLEGLAAALRIMAGQINNA